jgi:hypothetical protein
MIDDNKYFEEYFLSHSNQDTANHFGICAVSVWKRARKLGIKRKTNRHKDITVPFTEYQEQILTGSLLGDGSLTKIGKKNKLSSYEEGHCLQQKDYLHWKFERLKPFSVKFSKLVNNKTIVGFDKDILKAIYENRPHEFYFMRTIFHPLFKGMELKWYLRDANGDYIFNKNGKRIKIVPKDIKITFLSLAIWFFDDGWRNENDGQAYFSTLSFTFDECEFLVNKIKDLGISNCWVRDRNKKPEIAIGFSSYLDFINSIKPYVPDKCMEYKINLDGLKQTKYRHIMNKNIAVEIINLHNNNISQTEIAKRVNMSKTQVNRFLLGKTWKEYLRR